MLNTNRHYGFRTNEYELNDCLKRLDSGKRAIALILDFQEGYAVRESLVEGGLDVLKPMEGIEVPVLEMVVMMSGRVSPRWSPAGRAGVCWIVKKRRRRREETGTGRRSLACLGPLLPALSTLHRPFSAAPTSEGDAHAPRIFAPVMFHSETAMSKCPFL